MMKSNKSIKEKRWIFSWLIFLSLFVFLFVSVSYLMKPLGQNRYNLTGYYAEEKNSLDAVFIGGSSTFVYYAPMEAYNSYGIASYSLGYNSMPADTMPAIVKEALKTQNPELLVVDMRSFQVRDTVGIDEAPARNYSDNVNYSANRLKTILEIVPTRLNPGQNNNRWHYIFDIAKYHTRWKGLNKESFEYITNSHKNHKKGFYFVPKSAKMPLPASREITDHKPLSSQAQQVLDELLDVCKTSRKEILFVITPYSETAEEKQISNYLANKVHAAGYTFINTNDYYQEMGMDYDKDLYDKRHVNIFGAEKYTRFICKYIKENYDLPDRRNDPAYASWNEDYARWKVEADKTKEAIQKILVGPGK